MRVIKGFLIVITTMFVLAITIPVYAEGTYTIDTRQIHNGIFSVDYSIGKNDKVKLMVQKDGTTIYYDLMGDNDTEVFA